MPALVDDEQSSAAAYGLSAFPFLVAVNADGEVVARRSGELAPTQLAARLAARALARTRALRRRHGNLRSLRACCSHRTAR